MWGCPTPRPITSSSLPLSHSSAATKVQCSSSSFSFLILFSYKACMLESIQGKIKKNKKKTNTESEQKKTTPQSLQSYYLSVTQHDHSRNIASCKHAFVKRLRGLHRLKLCSWFGRKPGFALRCLTTACFDTVGRSQTAAQLQCFSHHKLTNLTLPNPYDTSSINEKCFKLKRIQKRTVSTLKKKKRIATWHPDLYPPPEINKSIWIYSKWINNIIMI